MKRLSCLVPFCRRTRGDRKGDPVDQYSEWICGDHMRMIPKLARRAYRRACRRLRDAETFGNVTVDEKGNPWISFSDKKRWLEHIRARRAADRLWCRVKTMATECALGLVKNGRRGARPSGQGFKSGTP